MVVAPAGNSFSREAAIRRRIANIYNKREEDFPTLRDYNDYLEEVEDMTFKLVEGVDVAAIEANIAKYQEENAEQIINSRARKAEELAKSLKEHQTQAATDCPSDMVSFLYCSPLGLSVNVHIIMPCIPSLICSGNIWGKCFCFLCEWRGLMFIIDIFLPLVHDIVFFMVLDQNSQAVGATAGGQYAPSIAAPMFMQPRPTGPAAQPVPIGGGNANSMPEDEATQRQRAERAARAGGWTPELCRKRAFEEAFGSLWIV